MQRPFLGCHSGWCSGKGWDCPRGGHSGEDPLPRRAAPLGGLAVPPPLTSVRLAGSKRMGWSFAPSFVPRNLTNCVRSIRFPRCFEGANWFETPTDCPSSGSPETAAAHHRRLRPGSSGTESRSLPFGPTRLPNSSLPNVAASAARLPNGTRANQAIQRLPAPSSLFTQAAFPRCPGSKRHP